jgi:V/A-type H+-transporting ATPase subunit E
MGLEKVIQDILRRGNAKKHEILSLGEKEREDQIRAAEEKAREESVKASARVETLLSQMEQQELSSAELEAKRVLLEAERKVMEELKEQVLDDLSNYPADRRKKMYARLVDNAKKEFVGCRVYSNKADRSLLQLPPGMTFGGVIESKGGLVFESEDKTVRLDFRFESILDDLWYAKMREIHAKLFR